MSTTRPGSPRTVLIEVSYSFKNAFKQTPRLSTAPPPTSPLTVEPSSTPVSTCMRSTSRTFADSDGEADLTDEDSDKPDLSPPEKVSFGKFHKKPAVCVRAAENVPRFRPVTPKEAASRSWFAKEVAQKDTSRKRV